MTEFLILVAIWCTNPTDGGYTHHWIDRCRAKAMECPINDVQAQLECFKKIKLGE